MKTDPKHYLIFISLLFGNILTLAQAPLTFTKYKAEHGLSSEFVTTIFQDSIGFLWLGTPGGVHRFDGYNFKVFRYDKADSLTLSNDAVWNIEEDRKGNIWIGTNNGLNRLDPKTEQITRIKSNPTSADSITNSLIMDLLVDKTGNVWVATANGLNRWLPQHECFEHYLYEPSPSKERPFRSSRTPIQTRNGIIWLGLQDTLCRYVAERNEFIYTKLPDNKAAANAIRLIYEDQEGLLWIGTQSNGVFSFDPVTSTFIEHYFNDPDDPNSISHNKISAFIQNGEELWIGTTGGGLNMLNLKTKSIMRHTGVPPAPFGVNSETIRDTWEDTQGNIWLGSFYDGLYQFKNSQRIFSNFDQNTGLLTKVVNDITETLDGKIWVAMGNAGVGVFDTAKKRFTKYYRNENNQQGLPLGNLKRLQTDHTGKLWVASETEGISYFDTQKGKFTKHLPKHKEDLSNFDFLTDFLVEENGDIWIALQTGLIKYQAATQGYKQYNMPDKADSKINHGANSFVTSILRDSQQQLWFTTYGGLNLYHPTSDSLEFFPFLNQLLGSIEDNNNNLWFSTLEGCYIFNINKKAFSKINNLIGNPFLKDDKQQIWLTSTEYLLKYNPVNGQITTLDKQDGLVSNFFWKAHQARDGYLHFGGIEGLSIFHPDSLKEVTQSPSVVLTDFQLFNKTVPIKGSKGDTLDWKSPLIQSIVFTKNIILKHWQNYFSIEFSALDFTNPASNRYQYQLEGYDKNWIESNADRRLITYTNLDPGTYIFQVKGASRNGPWSETTSVNIQILSP
ncbi:MAG: two-component regulator propeller domain-containing protein [Bacteroidota bacterium]